MYIGITVRFINSYFSGSTPQVACAIARALSKEHNVELVYPSNEQDWFIDNEKYSQLLPKRVPLGSNKKPYDFLIEVVWNLEPTLRKSIANHVIFFSYYPPIFYDMESSVYPVAKPSRNFKNISAIWTYDLYSKHDCEYLELLSGVPVQQVPYVWDSDALDTFVKQHNIPEWMESAKEADKKIPADIPNSISWCLRVFESNSSNSSHCVLPLCIISEIRKTVEPVRFAVHNGEHTSQSDFFTNNIVKNLLVPDISGAMLPRVRLPDIRREKVIVIAHQRWRPMKNYLLDAMYLGIPMIHNNKQLKKLGAPYFYDLNQIRDAVDAYKQLSKDYLQGSGFFSPNAEKVRQASLKTRFSPQANSQRYCELFEMKPSLRRPIFPKIQQVKQVIQDELRIGFANMWDQFQPEHNFFTYLLKYVGKKNNIRVIVDQEKPNCVFWGPLSNGSEQKWLNVPKVYYTGENVRPVRAYNTFLNIGFDYTERDDYIRLPLWMLEINWFKGDPTKMVNPLPVSIEDATTVPNIENERKFCAFVATNPGNPVRNTLFQTLNLWKPVDSGGRLFCNLPNGPIPSGLGGGGGELEKINFYKNYKYVLTVENSPHEGYCTEKLFHAKVAGAVPIYWGDRFVGRDFDKAGFIDLCEAKTPQDVIDIMKAVDDTKWKQMASVPALSKDKVEWCYSTMLRVSRKIFKFITNKDVTVDSWTDFNNLETSPKPTKRVYVTATNMKYAESALNALKSFQQVEPNTSCIVYVWPGIDEKVLVLLKNFAEVREFPVNTVKPWEDYWKPEHFAWKLWLLNQLNDEVELGTNVLYTDSGMVFVREIKDIWSHIETKGALVVNDPNQTNRRWCHPNFCKLMKTDDKELSSNQIIAGIIGFRKGAYDNLFQEANRIAELQRDIIVGNKWTPYNSDCLGHRHDQSILSILTYRYAIPRLNLDDIYCDISYRASKQFGVPFYVHRGNFKQFVSFTNGIDEIYLVNLQRRKDRLDTWKEFHKDIKGLTYVMYAIDGRTLELTPQLVHLFRENDFKWKKSVMGCALSHLRLWEKLAGDTEAKSYLILEDDVRLQSDWLSKWQSISHKIPQDADVIYLGGVLPPNKPMLQYVTEPINEFFAKVQPNSLFSPGSPRRYFHFCTYSYILTQSGARKLIHLVNQRGIFTSCDHMIVNHGDDFLNIYFTTPLLATCFQEDDPIYQKAEFNNFNRVDNFDSDLWNNTECFTNDEVLQCMEGRVKPRLENNNKEDMIHVWNSFLTAVANKLDLEEHIKKIFELWRHMDHDTFIKNFGWFRVFEQFVLNKQQGFEKYAQLIISEIETIPHDKKFFKEILCTLDPKIRENTCEVVTYVLPEKDIQEIYHIPYVNADFLEQDYLSELYGKPVVFKKLESFEQLKNAKNPTLLYQRVPHNMENSKRLYRAITEEITKNKLSINLLHLSDEFGLDDISIYNSYKKVFRNYFRNNCSENTIILPLGFTNSRGTHGLPESPSFEKREYLWSFAGSLDRPNRRESLSELKKTGKFLCEEKDTWDSPHKLDGPKYRELLRNTKFVPCFSGSCALESYRMYEALEHGAIPFYVVLPNQKDEYGLLFPEKPFLRFDSWEQASYLLPKLAEKTDILEKQRIACENWWKEQKKHLKSTIQNNYNM